MRLALPTIFTPVRRRWLGVLGKPLLLQLGHLCPPVLRGHDGSSPCCLGLEALLGRDFVLAQPSRLAVGGGQRLHLPVQARCARRARRLGLRAPALAALAAGRTSIRRVHAHRAGFAHVAPDPVSV